MDPENLETISDNKPIFSLDLGKLILPASIVLAAVLISGTLVFTSYRNNPGSQLGAVGNQAGSLPKVAKVDNGHFPIKGDQKAKVKIVEFGDLRCPFCQRFYSTTESQIISNYVNAGQASFAFRNFAFLGPASVAAANAVECANEQDKFWAFHDYLYQNQPPESDTSMFTVDRLMAIASKLGMDSGQFKSCLSSNKYNQNVSDDLSAGQQAGVTGTPSFFINGQLLVGAQPLSAFQQVIEQALQNK